MSIHIEDQAQDPKKPNNLKVFFGLLLMIIGIGYLFQQLDFFEIPNFLLSWPTLLIIIGLYIGAKHNFRNPAWIILIAIGGINLLDRIFPDVDFGRVTWPIGLIAVGIWFISKRNNSWDIKNRGGKWNANDYNSGKAFETVVKPITPVDPADPLTTEDAGQASAPPPGSSTNIPPTGGFGGPVGDNYLDSISIFGGVKKTILSKNFRGGEIVNIFGGSEIDFTQADINGRIVIDVTQIFGGTKIIVPSNWHVVSDLAAILGSVDDKRIRTAAPSDSNKTLVLKGVSIFAGVDIRSY